MPVEAKELIEYLGYDPKEIENIESFKEKFDPDFIKKSEVSKDETLVNSVVGKRVVSIQTALKTGAKAIGIDLEGSEIKDKKVEDIASIIFGKIGTQFKTLEGQKGQGNEEATREWKEKYEKLEGRFNDNKKLLDSNVTELENFKSNIETEKKNYKITSTFDKAISQFKWKNGITDVEKEGFITLFNKAHKVDIDDEGVVFVGNEKGERIKNPKKANEFKNIDDLLVDFGTEKGVYAIGGTQKTGVGQFVQQTKPNTQPAQGRQAHPRARGLM